MLFIALSLLGYVSYKQLPVELLPNAELPVLFVQVSSQQDMDPSYVESEVIIPLEGAVSAIGGVDKLQSYIDRRQSSIQIDFKKNINFKMTSLKLQEKVNEIAASLPTGFTVQVQKVDIAQMNNNFMVLQVRGTGGTDRVRSLVDEDVRSDLENIDGVASVNIYGGRQKAIEVRLNPEACKALNLTASKISGLLSQNTQEKTFVGFADEPDSKNFVHVNAMYTKVSDLENIVVAPGPILLKDLATVFFDLKDETTYSRVNGKEAVSVALINDSQANLIELSHRVSDVIEKLNEKLAPLELEIVIQENKAETMENNINQIINLALVGGLLAVFVLWLFLKNMRLVFFDRLPQRFPRRSAGRRFSASLSYPLYAALPSVPWRDQPFSSLCFFLNTSTWNFFSMSVRASMPIAALNSAKPGTEPEAMISLLEWFSFRLLR